MHKLMRYIKGYEKQAVLAPLFKMLEATFELFVPLVVASISTPVSKMAMPCSSGNAAVC